MEPTIVMLAMVVTALALIIKRNLLVLAAALVIIGGELLVKSEVFTTFSVIVLAGCAQLLLYLGCKTIWDDQVVRSKRLQLFTELTLLCAVLSASKLVGFMVISDAVIHDAIQYHIESFLLMSTITMAFLLLLSPTDKVPLHGIGRNIWSAIAHGGHSHNHNRQVEK